MKIERYKQNDEIVANYLVELRVLNADKIDVGWIHDRLKNGSDKKAPKAWKKWVSKGNY